MNYSRLRSFHAVAAEGSFTRAAQRLGVSQPTLSAQVKALEEDYGVALFARRGRGVVLTELGKRLRDVTLRLFAVEEEAAELLSQAGALATGELRLGADSPAHAVPFLAAFRRRHPGIALTLAIGNAEEVLDGLLQHRSDVAVVADLADDQRFEAIPCGRHRLVALVPRDHALARRRAVRLATLASRPAVMREPGSRTRGLFEAALADAGLAVPRGVVVESREAVREAVAADLGIGIVSAGEVGHDDRLAAVPIADLATETSEYVVCLKERRNLRLVAAFLDEARLLAGY